MDEFRKIDDSKVATRLLDKNYSPLIVRKYQFKGWPLFLGIICDVSLSDLDNVFYDIVKKCDDAKMFEDNDLQKLRNFTGILSDGVINHYNEVKRGSVEGVGIFWYVDKCAISSLYGDLMTHGQCRSEFYFIINTLPHI
jgi:hypothetical protein